MKCHNACCIVCGALLRRERRHLNQNRFAVCPEHQRKVSFVLRHAMLPPKCEPSPPVPKATPAPFSGKIILVEVADKHRISLEQLKAYDRLRKMFAIRREAARRLRYELGISLTRIGQLLGGRDHSTIARMVNDEYRRRHMDRIRANNKGWRQRAREEARA